MTTFICVIYFSIGFFYVGVIEEKIIKKYPRKMARVVIRCAVIFAWPFMIALGRGVSYSEKSDNQV